MQSVDISAQAGTVRQALRQASQRTGVGFDYLLHTAMRESGLDAGARAGTSSASGLFQFVEQTWLETLKRAGEGLGLAHLAARIERAPDGRYEVADAAAREEILGLRNDPATSALMAAALTRRNAAQLAVAIGRQPTGGELYVAHFLGAGDATRLINLVAREPQADATVAFPRAARANPAIFQARDGTARSVAQVYSLLTRQPNTPATAVAEALKSVESRVAGFFSSLFRLTAEAGATPAAKTTDDVLPASPRRPARAPGAPLVLADFMRPRAGAVGGAGTDAAASNVARAEAGKLAARDAYDTQVRWFAALYRS